MVEIITLAKAPKRINDACYVCSVTQPLGVKSVLNLSLLALLLLTACATVPNVESTATTSTSPGVNATDDRSLIRAVETAIAQDPSLEGARVQVAADGGRITLTGQVRNARDFLRIQSVVRSVPGVRPPVNVEAVSYNP